MAEQAGEKDCDIVVLGEAITLIGRSGKDHCDPDVAQTVPGPATRRLGEVAKKYGMYIVAGLDERDGEGVYSTAVLIDRRGEVAGKYRKVTIPREELGPSRRFFPRDLTVGHYKPIAGERFVNDCHEYVFHFTHHGTVRLDRLGIGVAYQDRSNLRRWAGAAEGVHCRGNAWFIPYRTIQHRQKDRPHPATFPVRLPELCLRLHGTSRCRLVLDPFLGLGSTAVACASLNLSFVGFEIDQFYLGEAIRRVKEVAGRLWPAC